MASDIVTAKAEAPGRPRLNWRWYGGSRLGRLIVGLNLVGLFILVVGALVMNEFRQGLIQTRLESLSAQAELLAEVMAQTATRGVPEPQMEFDLAVDVLQRFIPQGQRARLFDADGHLLVDSYAVSEDVDVQALPPARKPDARPPREPDLEKKAKFEAEARADLKAEVDRALTGERVADVRHSETGERVVSVSIPVQRVDAVLGVLTLEAGDVDAIVNAQRRSLLPFAAIAIGVSLLSSVLLHLLVARPVMRLSAAADQVRLSRARAISLPDLEARDDEIGDLARSLETMTATLSDRMDAIERFAADVSHEIKNPLTSIRSAIETLDLVKDDKAKAKLTGVLKQDVKRLDRLITDISNASRLDAELSREQPRPVDLGRLLADLSAAYNDAAREDEPKVKLMLPSEPLGVAGREGPLGQVFRNLIDNARSFGKPGGEVRVVLQRSDADPARPVLIRVEDDGPGIPTENLETIFQRFYTSRPKGTAFGGNSGLGLSISRQIVEAHGGRIWAENIAGADGNVAGARLSIALPEAAR